MTSLLIFDIFLPLPEIREAAEAAGQIQVLHRLPPEENAGIFVANFLDTFTDDHISSEPRSSDGAEVANEGSSSKEAS